MNTNEDKKLEVLIGRIEAFKRKMAAKYKATGDNRTITFSDYHYDFEGEKEWRDVALHVAADLTYLKWEREQFEREFSRLQKKCGEANE